MVEDNIFEILILMSDIAELQVGPEETDKETSKETNKEIKTNKETSKEISRKTASEIIEILETKPEIAVSKIAESLNISASGVRYHINKMKKAGMIEHVGSTKKGKWIIYK